MTAAPALDDLHILTRGHFRLSSGLHSDTYLQCALALQDPATALRLGAALAERVPAPVDVVASPAIGGILAGFAVAAALGRRFVFAERDPDRRFTFRRGQAVAPGERVLVVEDVVTTGGSAREVAELVAAQGATHAATATLVDRSGASPGDDGAPVSLFQVTARTWAPADCPLCAQGRPLDTPGSRHGP
jgi:orotate phosphoribosyltransferase